MKFNIIVITYFFICPGIETLADSSFLMWPFPILKTYNKNKNTLKFTQNIKYSINNILKVTFN